MAVGDAYVFPGFLTPVLTLLFFPKPPTTFLTCFCRGERRKYAGKKGRLNRGSNSQPPGHESDTLTTEPPWRGSGCQILRNPIFEMSHGVRKLICLQKEWIGPNLAGMFHGRSSLKFVHRVRFHQKTLAAMATK